jgi:cupin 2 domain-containing protein
MSIFEPMNSKQTGNIYSSLPVQSENEQFEDLVRAKNLRIERIFSKGHTSPEEGWYDQIENEWVIVLDGSGIIQFEDGTEITLRKGDYLNIPSRAKHKVTWTDPNNITVWLAVFYS